MHGVAEVDHRHGQAARGDHPAPGLVVALVAGAEHHPAAVDVVDARQDLFARRADVLDFHRVAVRRRGEGQVAHDQAGGWRDVFTVHAVEDRDLTGVGGAAFSREFLAQQFLAAGDIGLRGAHGHPGEGRLDAGIETRIEINLRGHGGGPFKVGDRSQGTPASKAGGRSSR